MTRAADRGSLAIRRRIALVALTAGVLALTACTPPLQVDLDLAREWVDQTDDLDAADAVGGAMMLAGPADATESDEGDEPTGITLGFADPVTVSAFRVRCFGGGTAMFVYDISGATSAFGWGGEVPCDEEAHTIETNDDYSRVDAVRVDATSDPATYVVVAVIGEAPAK